MKQLILLSSLVAALAMTGCSTINAGIDKMADAYWNLWDTTGLNAAKLPPPGPERDRQMARLQRAVDSMNGSCSNKGGVVTPWPAVRDYAYRMTYTSGNYFRLNNKNLDRVQVRALLAKSDADSLHRGAFCTLGTSLRISNEVWINTDDKVQVSIWSGMAGQEPKIGILDETAGPKPVNLD